MKPKKTAKGFGYVFNPAHLQELLNENPDKIVISTSLEGEVLKSGEKVGVMRVKASSIVNNKISMTISGCPIPPCRETGEEEILFPEDALHLEQSELN